MGPSPTSTSSESSWIYFRRTWIRNELCARIESAENYGRKRMGQRVPADVAVEMHRLRQALESYYNGEGRNDHTIITLPSRATPAVNGMKDRRWITAESRVLTGDPAVSSLEQVTAQDQPRRPDAKLGFIAIIAGVAAAAILAGAFIRSATTDDRPHAAAWTACPWRLPMRPERNCGGRASLMASGLSITAEDLHRSFGSEI